MNRYIFKFTSLFIASGVFLALIFLNSCIPQKRIKLVQNKIKSDTTTTFTTKKRPKSTVQPFDNLYIKVISPDEETSNLFNSETRSSVQQNVNYNMISYTVNDSGYIDFPFVGSLKVKDLTILEAKEVIKTELSKYISNVTVTVKFIGKSVTIIGEVRRQGTYDIFSDNINIFAAVALANGLTDYGDRNNVTIIREIDGIVTYHIVDLTDKHIVNSDFYYLKPEDIIIVQPLKQKSYGFSSFPYGIVMSGITTIIALITLMRTY